MNVKTTIIFWIICAYRITVVFPNAANEESNFCMISNLLGPMVHNIACRYFINSHCICVVTEENGIILKYIPKSASVFHIQIGGIGSAIKEIEDSDTLDSTKLTNDTQKFERLLTEAMNRGCEPYIVQVRNIRSVTHSFARTTRRAVTRYRKKFVYLPITLEDEILQLQNILSMKEMNYMPDLIIARFANSENTKSHLIQCGHDDNNSKDRSYKSKVIMNLKADTSMTSPRDRQENEKRQEFFKSIGNGVLIQEDKGNNFTASEESCCTEESNCDTSAGSRCMEESNCAISAGGRFMEASDDINMVKNTSVNLCKASSLNKINDNMNAIEIVTHKFVGQNPSSEVVLDVWVTDGQHAGFLTCSDLFPDKIRNLEGRVVKVTTLNYVPFVVLIHGEETPVYGGSEFLMFIEFAKKLNFTWKLVLDEENFWGAVWSNGSGNGVIGKKYENKMSPNYFHFKSNNIA
jgi:hypothetical protein